MKDLKEEIVENDEILNIVNDIVEGNETIKDLEKDYSDKIKNLKETLLDYMGENDLKNQKQDLLTNGNFQLKS